jgi:adenylate cyclase
MTSTAIDQRLLAEAIDWMIDGCVSAPTAELVLDQTCARLIACGVPLAHAAVFVRTLHPEIMGRRWFWQAGSGSEGLNLEHDIFEDPEYRASPIKYVFDEAKPLRRRLDAPDCPTDFTFLARFREQGVTDFLAFPLRASDGTVNACAWMTKMPGGFSDAAVAALEAIVRPMARMVEVRALKRIAINLLDTYVGGQAGARILAGQIRRGNVQSIRAAIWLSDMRDFTARADRMPAADLVALLNRYFDCQVPAIREQGGEVLKFMGDGLLAIFPIETSVTAGCDRALTAARKVEAEIAAADWGGLEAPGGVKFGVALHVGEVLYGNIGSTDRLDFTCIGPAVNIAARIERLTVETGRTILASAEFAAACGDRMVPLGSFALKGVSVPQSVYGVA